MGWRLDPRTRRKLPEIVWHVLPSLAAGCVAGVVAAFALVVFNQSLRALILGSEIGWLAMILLIIGCVVTFGSVAAGHAIITLGGKDE